VCYQTLSFALCVGVEMDVNVRCWVDVDVAVLRNYGWCAEGF
jgi:hypothetical protein